jgi:uncharacterized protein YdcH (DUF465 family)
MVNSKFVSDSELTGYVNSSIAELYDLLTAAYGSDYNLSSYSFTTVNGTQDYALPADFYKLKGVDSQINNDLWFSIRPFNFNERNRNQDIVWGLIGGPSIRYRMVGGNIRFSPMPTGIFNMRLWYVPLATKLVADADVFNDINQFSEYVVVDAAIKMMQKEESDVSVLMAQKNELKKRIESMAADRDAGQPETVSDIYAENNEYWFWRSQS